MKGLLSADEKGYFQPMKRLLLADEKAAFSS